MRKKSTPLIYSQAVGARSVKTTWVGEGEVWARADIAPPPDNPNAFADLVLRSINEKLLVKRPRIAVSLDSLTDDVATYTVHGGGEELIYYGIRALSAEQNTLEHIALSLRGTLQTAPVN